MCTCFLQTVLENAGSFLCVKKTLKICRPYVSLASALYRAIAARLFIFFIFCFIPFLCVWGERGGVRGQNLPWLILNSLVSASKTIGVSTRKKMRAVVKSTGQPQRPTESLNETKCTWCYIDSLPARGSGQYALYAAGVFCFVVMNTEHLF